PPYATRLTVRILSSRQRCWTTHDEVARSSGVCRALNSTVKGLVSNAATSALASVEAGGILLILCSDIGCSSDTFLDWGISTNEGKAKSDCCWADSNARRFCAALVRQLIHHVPGFEATPRGIEEDTVPAYS